MTSAWTALLRQVAELAGNLLLSRVVSVGGLLIFAALSGPEPFAPFGVYLAAVTILWVVVCGRYEQAIVFAATPREASALVWLAGGIGLMVTAAALIAALALLTAGPSLPSNIFATPLLLALAPLSLAARAASRILLNIATRESKFAALTRANWVQAAIQASLQLILLGAGTSPVLCLALADLAGIVAAALTVLACTPAAGRMLAVRPRLAEISTAARTWRMMPCWSLPTSLMSVVALSVPAILLPALYSPALAGQLNLAMRLLEMPANIFSSAATPVLQRALSSAGRKTDVIRRALWLLVTVSLAGFAVAALASTATAELIGQSRWSAAMAAVPWLVPYYTGLAISGPLVSLVAGVRAERRALWPHLVFLVLSCIVAALSIAAAPGWQLVLAGFGLAMLVRTLMFSLLLLHESASAVIGRS